MPASKVTTEVPPDFQEAIPYAASPGLPEGASPPVDRAG